jgi:hypothetical protein
MEMPLIWALRKAVYFQAWDWTMQISLNSLTNLSFPRFAYADSPAIRVFAQ